MNAFELTEGDELNMWNDEDGNSYVCHGPMPEWAKPAGVHGAATVSRVEPGTNTIWFSTPIPKGLSVPKRRIYGKRSRSTRRTD